MFEIQAQGRQFIVDVVHSDSGEEPEGKKTMCLAKVGALTFQYQMTAEEAHPFFKADLERALEKRAVDQTPQPVVFVVVRYAKHFMVDWAFHERRISQSLIGARLGLMNVADAAISEAGGGPADSSDRA